MKPSLLTRFVRWISGGSPTPSGEAKATKRRMNEAEARLEMLTASRDLIERRRR